MISCLFYTPRPGTKPATQACALAGSQTGGLSLSRMTLSRLSHTGQALSYFLEKATLLTHHFTVHKETPTSCPIGIQQLFAHFTLSIGDKASTDPHYFRLNCACGYQHSFENETTLEQASGPILDHCFLNFTVHRNHQGTLLKCRFLYSRFRAGSEILLGCDPCASKFCESF